MQNVRQLMRRKAYRTFFVSFVLIFLLPLLVLAAVMLRMSGNVRQETEMSSQLVLAQFKSGVDSQLYTVMRLADNMLVDDKALYFAERDDPMRYLNNISSFQMLKNLAQEVGAMSTSYVDITQCYLYLPRSEKVISNTISDAPDFFARKLPGSFANSAEWIEFINGQPDGFFRRDGVHYLRTLRRGDMNLLTVVMDIDNAPFDDYHALFDTQSFTEAAVFSQRGEPLFFTGAVIPDLPDEIHIQPTGTLLIRSESQTMRAHWMHSAETQCIYLTLTPETVYARPMRTMAITSVFGGCMLLLTGLFLSLTMARRQYRPIFALRAFIDSNAGNTGDEHADDFGYLSEMLRAIHDESKTTAMLLRDNEEKSQQFALERVLKGMYASVEIMEEQLLSQNIALDAARYAVVGIRVDSLGDGVQALKPEELQLMRFVLVNVLEEQLAAYGARAAVCDGLMWLICGLPGDTDDWHGQMEALLRDSDHFLHERFDFVLTITCSDSAEGVEGIHRGYRSALRLMRQAEGQPHSFLCAWQQPRPEDGASPTLTANSHVQPLAQCVHEGDTEGAMRVLDSLHRQMGALPHYLAHLQWNALLQGLLPYLNGRSEAEQQAIQQRMRAFVEAPPLQDDYAAMRAFCQYLCSLPPLQSENAKGLDIAQKVEAFIEENYTSGGLNITEIADHLNLTASYASALYKKQTGESMLDTINRVRLTRAKEMLLQTSLPVEDIAAQVGYYSSSTFLRAFKKHEGVTPGQYRSMTPRA